MQIRSRLLLFPLVFVFSSSCLSDETYCNYFQLTERALYNQTWHVDSLTIEIKDSIGNFHFDTTYINDGTWEFVPEGSENLCARGGHIKLTRSNGQTETFIYSYSSYGPYKYDVLCLSSQHSIDPLNEAFQQCLCYRLSDKLRINGSSKYGCTEYHSPTERKRQWKFVLSKQ